MEAQKDQSNPYSNEDPDQNGLGFEQFKLANPCQSCEAPCCKMLLIPYQTPNTFMDLDYVKYMLGFPGINMILYQNGTWQVQVEQNCRHLNTEDNTCKIHNTPHKPKTCVFFNPYNCFYKRNFSEEHPRNIIIINARSFDILINQIEFDKLGNIISIPSQEEIKRMTRENARSS